MVRPLLRALVAVAMAGLMVGGSSFWTVVNDRSSGGADDGGVLVLPSGIHAPASSPDLPIDPDQPSTSPLPDDNPAPATPPSENPPPTMSPPPAPSPTLPGLPIDLDKVSALDDVRAHLLLSDAQLQFLRENAMVGIADPSYDFEKFADAYEWIIEHENLPVFVTSDSMLDAYHLIFDELLAQIEERMLIGDAINFSQRMMMTFDRLASTLPADHRSLATDNVAFFGAALRMLDPNATVPGYAKDTVERIVGLAMNATGFIVPPGFAQLEDFTQYKVRGHYTRSEQLGRYFRAMMWYGRITFHGSSANETRRAVMIALQISADDVAAACHLRISSIVDYMVGAADDLTYKEYAEAARSVFGEMGPDYSALFDDGKLGDFKACVANLRQPKILSDLVTDWQVEGAGSWENVAVGMRVFGQRFVPDSYIFQNCVYDSVPEPNPRMMPSALDVLAALGSEEAWSREDFKSFNPAFETNLADLKQEFAGKTDEDWNVTLYMAWLDALRTLHGDMSTKDYPMFMRTVAWKAKELNTQAGSWTQLTHDTILYRKQSYTVTITCVQAPIMDPDFTYVEPVPSLFEHLESMTRATKGLLDGLDIEIALVNRILTDLSTAFGSLKRVAMCELNGSKADPKDLEVARWAYKITTLEIGGEKLQSKTVIVSDVHTDPNSMRCLEEGVGYVKLMVVVVPSNGGFVACVGPVFEHNEFTQPLSAGRLTDEEWTAMLEEGSAATVAPWCRDFQLY